MKNIIFLSLAAFVATQNSAIVAQAATSSVDAKIEQAVTLKGAVTGTLNHLILHPAEKIQCSQREALAAKECLQTVRRGLELSDKTLDSLTDREQALENLMCILSQKDDILSAILTHVGIFEDENTIVKLLHACMESLSDPIFQAKLIEHMKHLRQELLTSAEANAHTLAKEVGADAQVAQRTIAQLKNIEPHIAKLVKIGCGLAHNKAAAFYNQLLSGLSPEQKAQFTKRRNVACSFKPMATYALVKKFYDDAIEPWITPASKKVVKLTKGIIQEAVSDQDNAAINNFLQKRGENPLIQLCDELIKICDKKLNS